MQNSMLNVAIHLGYNGKVPLWIATCEVLLVCIWLSFSLVSAPLQLEIWDLKTTHFSGIVYVVKLDSGVEFSKLSQTVHILCVWGGKGGAS